MNPIRILDLRSVIGGGGGPEKTILQGAAGANRSEFEITVCYLRDRRDTESDIAERARALCLDYAEIVERHSLDPRVWTQLVALCRARGFHAVHAHEYKSDFFAWLLSVRLGVTAIATAHGWSGHSLKERCVYYPADRRLLARFTKVIAVSGEIRDELLNAGARANAVTVVLNGIDAARFVRRQSDEQRVRAELEVPPGAFVIGAVGRLEREKRFDLLLDAVAQLRSRHANLHMLIAGTGSLLGPLTQRIGRLGLTPYCRLIGHCTDIVRFHHALDLFVQSSENEGTSNAVLEAMALETPVVATDAGGTAEVLRPGVDGLIVRRGSVSALAEGIDRMVRDPALRARFRAEARRRVEGPLSFSSRMAAVEQIYREVACGHTARRVRP